MRYLRVWQTGQRWRDVATVLVALFVLTGSVAHLSAGYWMSRFVLTTGANGSATPATLGVPFERAAILSRGRKLDGYVVSAERSCKGAPVLLIYHGSQETISEWVKSQRFLYLHCVSSVIFDASGSGDSSRPASIERVDQDAVSAYQYTVSRFPYSRIYVLGHSLGNGVMLGQIPNFPAPPSGVIVAGAYSSLRGRDIVRKHLLYRVLICLMPDWWNNVEAVKQINIPLLVVHSDADRVNPIGGGLEVYNAANQPKTLVVLHGFAHNDLYQSPSDEWWDPVLSFMHAPGRIISSTSDSVLR